MNPNIHWEFVQAHPEMSWNDSLYSNPNIQPYDISNNPKEWPHWDLSHNPTIDDDFIKKYIPKDEHLGESSDESSFKELDWGLLVRGSAVSVELAVEYGYTDLGDHVIPQEKINWEFIATNRHLNWDWEELSSYASWDIIITYPNFPWNWYQISRSKNITWEIVYNNPNPLNSNGE